MNEEIDRARFCSLCGHECEGSGANGLAHHHMSAEGNPYTLCAVCETLDRAHRSVDGGTCALCEKAPGSVVAFWDTRRVLVCEPCFEREGDGGTE